MSNHLERRAPGTGGIARKGNHTVDAGQATEISELTFEGRVLEHSADMPKAFRPGAKASTQMALQKGNGQANVGGEVVRADASSITSLAPQDEASVRRIERDEIASCVNQLDKPRNSSGRVVQRRIGWRATPDRIIITVAERELRKNPTGTYSPAGPWLIELRRTFKEVSGKAAKRTGSVTADSNRVTSSGNDGESTSGTERTVSEKFPDASRALGALPAAVRSSAIARVPAPSQFEGELLEYSDSTGRSTSWKVTVLRMDSQRAVVVTGSKEANSNTWSVMQASYNLMEPELEQG
ncbi:MULTISPECIES: hypothetical protein [unclassified Brevibacterium]|uniref:hypothetical protein n=1 Tax=unclassified Brevibacterium TaxID=2614124 RepID=UPI001091FD65|nr:hypothetical protein [Brevibacterium sp. S22]